MTLKEMRELPIGELYYVDPKEGADDYIGSRLAVTRIPGGWLYFLDSAGAALFFVPEPKEEA